mgnify:CR=1 FL=1
MDWILKREGVRGPYVERNSVGYTEAQHEAMRGYFHGGQLWKYNPLTALFYNKLVPHGTTLKWDWEDSDDD